MKDRINPVQKKQIMEDIERLQSIVEKGKRFFFKYPQLMGTTEVKKDDVHRFVTELARKWAVAVPDRTIMDTVQTAELIIEKMNNRLTVEKIDSQIERANEYANKENTMNNIDTPCEAITKKGKQHVTSNATHNIEGIRVCGIPAHIEWAKEEYKRRMDEMKKDWDADLAPTDISPDVAKSEIKEIDMEEKTRWTKDEQQWFSALVHNIRNDRTYREYLPHVVDVLNKKQFHRFADLKEWAEINDLA